MLGHRKPYSRILQLGTNVISRRHPCVYSHSQTCVGRHCRGRKEDIVGGMVTSGLASSIGWVLGAEQDAGGK
ncbi:hypothetical protein BDZ91DRAFT_714440 [Kalaharituber pfeilii]|nr:hypothetical protein BDZ91DRAFT_714440 [Kalaharituber pfeilii]